MTCPQKLDLEDLTFGGIVMAKYSTECKLKVVQEYLAGHGSYETLSKRYHVPRTPFQRWVKAYKTFGVDGLKPSHTKKIYTLEFKRSAVECYLLTGASYQDVATIFGLNNSTLLVRWTNEVVHEAAQGGENLSEHVTQGELSGQQRDGELLWTLKAGDLLWARLP